MKNKYSIQIIAFLGTMFLTLSPKAFSQQVNHNNNIWLHYIGKNKLTNKLSLTLEASMRYTQGLNQKQQYFIRPSLDYQFNKSFVGSIGYSHYNTYVYGEYPINKTNIPEDHIWIQVTHTANSGDFKFTNRLRDEYRLVGIPLKKTDGDYEIDHYDYRNRLRYMFILNHPLIKDADGKSKMFLNIGNEVFINIGVKEAKTLVQQNRVIAGFGYNINTHHQVQLNYIHQNIWNLKNTIQENNPTLRLSYLTNFDWYKK